MSNPYPATFDRFLTELPTDGRALDCGSGARHHHDRRVTTLDGKPDRQVDVVADVTALPFPDATFDLVLSQAVLEHIRNPQGCVDEMVRVLRPGGHLVVEVAFMQPYHAAPDHYQNLTPSGLAHLCRDMDTVDTDVRDGLAVVVGWMGVFAGAVRTLGHRRWDAILDSLVLVDTNMTPDQLAHVAGVATLTARKP